MALEVLYLNDLIKEFSAIDRTTGALTRKHFLRRVEEEVQRAEDYGSELAFVSVAVDDMPDHVERYGRKSPETILAEIVKLVRPHVRPYDLLGRQEDDRLGIVLVETAATDAYVWAEKIRKLIASSVVAVEGHSFSLTVSVGVCGLTEGMRAQELMSGTSQVLGKAIAGGGNLVRVY
jgi:diguanylate cyclase (GGDEF)-like protein